MFKNKYLIEILFYIFLSCLIMLIFSAFDFAEYIAAVAKKYEFFELDELLLCCPIILFFGLIFTIRRMLELKETNRQLSIAQDLLEKTNKELLELNSSQKKIMAIAFHELASPVNTISSAMTLLKISGSKDVYDKNFCLLNSSVTHLKIYSADILKVIRLTLGHKLETPETFNPYETLEEALFSASHLAWNKDIKFSHTCSDGMPHSINGFDYVLRHIVQNLCINSVKYTVEGEVKIELDFDWANETFIIKVLDTGPGIPEEMKNYIFKPFHAQNNEKSIQGTGLGLSIVKSLVDTFKGDITVMDNAPKGTVVEVVLPVEPKPDILF